MLINSRGTCLCKSSYQYCSVGESKLCVYFPLFSPVHSVQNKQMPNTLNTFFNFSLFDLKKFSCRIISLYCSAKSPTKIHSYAFKSHERRKNPFRGINIFLGHNSFFFFSLLCGRNSALILLQIINKCYC